MKILKLVPLLRRGRGGRGNIRLSGRVTVVLPVQTRLARGRGRMMRVNRTVKFRRLKTRRFRRGPLTGFTFLIFLKKFRGRRLTVRRRLFRTLTLRFRF